MDFIIGKIFRCLLDDKCHECFVIDQQSVLSFTIRGRAGWFWGVHDDSWSQAPLIWNKRRLSGQHNRYHLLAGKSWFSFTFILCHTSVLLPFLSHEMNWMWWWDRCYMSELKYKCSIILLRLCFNWKPRSRIFKSLYKNKAACWSRNALLSLLFLKSVVEFVWFPLDLSHYITWLVTASLRCKWWPTEKVHFNFSIKELKNNKTPMPN